MKKFKDEDELVEDYYAKAEVTGCLIYCILMFFLLALIGMVALINWIVNLIFN